MKKNIHRATPDSLNGRRMRQAKGAITAHTDDMTRLTAEQLEWNRQREAQLAARRRRFD